MSTLEETRASPYKEEVQLTEREKFRLAIGLGAIVCGIILAFGFAVYLFGAEATVDGVVGFLALGAIIYIIAVVASFVTFGEPR